MEQSLVALKEWHGEVVDYQYVGADGVTVSVGDSMPITVGETGWKARQTNPASEIESFAALRGEPEVVRRPAVRKPGRV